MCDLHRCQTFNRFRLLCMCQVCRRSLSNSNWYRGDSPLHSVMRKKSTARNVIELLYECVSVKSANKGEIQMRENKWQNHSSAVTCRSAVKNTRVLGENSLKAKQNRLERCTVKETYRKYCSALWWHLCAYST